MPFVRDHDRVTLPTQRLAGDAICSQKHA